MRTGGRLITFSGLDGAGKSTQIQLLLERLREQGEKPVYLWTRGGYTPGLEAAKAIWRRLMGRAAPPQGHSEQRDQAFQRPAVRRVWLTLALLDLLWVYGICVRWWRWRGRTVVGDRYLWDTDIDFQLNFPRERVDRWWLWRLLARVTPRPDVALVLLIPVEESVRRSDLKGEPYRDSPATLAQRLACYETWAIKTGLQVLDGRKPQSVVSSDVLEAVRIHSQSQAH